LNGTSNQLSDKFGGAESDAAIECKAESIMSTEENKAIVRRYVQEVVNEGKIELVDSIFASELAFHLPHFTGSLRGREILRQLIGQTRTVFPDMRMDIQDILAEADKVFTRGTFQGTYHGTPLGGSCKIADGVMPIVLIPGMTLFRIQAGNRRREGPQICEVWIEENFVEVLRQLGIPARFPPELACIKGWSN
jgi:predicted ester cyclase